MNMEKEQETVEHRNKLEEIADRSAEAYRISKETGVPLTQAEQDRQKLLGLLSAPYALVDEFKTFARNIRHNNYDNRETWNERARTYEDAARELSHWLDEAVAKLEKHED